MTILFLDNCVPKYLKWSKYVFLNPNGDFITRGTSFREFSNQLDFTEVIISFLVFVITRTSGSFLSSSSFDDLLRFGIVFPILRLFTQVYSTSDLVYTLAVIMPQFTHLFVLLLISFYIFVVYGVLIFRNEFSILSTRIPNGNFDSLKDAFLSQFQIFLEQDWANFLCK